MRVDSAAMKLFGGLYQRRQGMIGEQALLLLTKRGGRVLSPVRLHPPSSSFIIFISFLLLLLHLSSLLKSFFSCLLLLFPLLPPSQLVISDLVLVSSPSRCSSRLWNTPGQRSCDTSEDNLRHFRVSCRNVNKTPRVSWPRDICPTTAQYTQSAV